MAEQRPVEPDPRVYFAAERTLLAWIRTGTAMMGFGFVVARFGLFLRAFSQTNAATHHETGGVSMWSGTALILLGVIVLVFATREHIRNIGRIQRGELIEPQRISLSVILSSVLSLLGLLMAGYLVTTFR
jgi:putative membrane protein